MPQATYNIHVRKLRIKIAPCKVRLRCPPAIRIGISRPNVTRDAVRGEVPNLDTGRCPKRGIHTATPRIERSAVGSSTVALDTTAVEAATSATICLGNVSPSLSTVLIVHRHTAWRAVQCHLVIGVQMDAFVDVDLSRIGPIRTDHPAARVR